MKKSELVKSNLCLSIVHVRTAYKYARVRCESTHPSTDSYLNPLILKEYLETPSPPPNYPTIHPNKPPYGVLHPMRDIIFLFCYLLHLGVGVGGVDDYIEVVFMMVIMYDNENGR